MKYPAPFIERFRAQTSEPDDNGCMLWEGTCDKGYGIAWRNGERYAHRHSWQIANGRIPFGKIVRHKCDVKNCVNPEHLLVGTHADNAKDALERNRYASGSKRRPDITDDIILDARARYHSKQVKLPALAQELNMCKSQVSDIMWGRLWRDVPMPKGVRPRPRRRKLKRDRRKTR